MLGSKVVAVEFFTFSRFEEAFHCTIIPTVLLSAHTLNNAYLSAFNLSLKTLHAYLALSLLMQLSLYAAANGGRHALTHEWAVELLPYGIRVNAVGVFECATLQCDSWLQTHGDIKRKLKEIINRMPLGKRMTTPDEILDTAVFSAITTLIPYHRPIDPCGWWLCAFRQENRKQKRACKNAMNARFNFNHLGSPASPPTQWGAYLMRQTIAYKCKTY